MPHLKVTHVITLMITPLITPEPWGPASPVPLRTPSSALLRSASCFALPDPTTPTLVGARDVLRDEGAR